MSGLSDRRSAARIDKLFRVMLSTEEHGELWYLARNISGTGMFVEMAEPLPLRTKVIVRFALPGQTAGICAVARVQNHYYLQYADPPRAHEREAEPGEPGPGVAVQSRVRGLTGVGLRFLRFVPEAGALVPLEQLH